MPFAVKNLFDVKGVPTWPAPRSTASHAPPARCSPSIERLEAAGAVLVGALNMGEYAYDFTGENVHDGPSRNPHDTTRMTGGSSGGSGGAVGGGLVPLALGSDTNGSIRVPASFCGIFGLKPTYGRLSRARSFPFVASFDHLGPLARADWRDLALAYDPIARIRCRGPVLRRRGGPPRSRFRRLARGIARTAESRLPAVISARVLRRKPASRRNASRRGARRQCRHRNPPRPRVPAPRPYIITATESARSRTSIACARAPRTIDPPCATG